MAQYLKHIIKSEKTISENDILNLENEIGFKFSEDYKKFLLEFGYARFDEMMGFDIKGNGNSGFTYFNSNLNPYTFKLYNNHDEFEKDKIIIAIDLGGNAICLTKEGTIEFWDHEGYDKEFYEIANNFTEFLENLYE